MKIQSHSLYEANCCRIVLNDHRCLLANSDLPLKSSQYIFGTGSGTTKTVHVVSLNIFDRIWKWILECFGKDYWERHICSLGKDAIMLNDDGKRAQFLDDLSGFVLAISYPSTRQKPPSLRIKITNSKAQLFIEPLKSITVNLKSYLVWGDAATCQSHPFSFNIIGERWQDGHLLKDQSLFNVPKTYDQDRQPPMVIEVSLHELLGFV